MEMGTFCSKPLCPQRSKCCKRKFPFRTHTPSCKRIKYTPVSQTEPIDPPPTATTATTITNDPHTNNINHNNTNNKNQPLTISRPGGGSNDDGNTRPENESREEADSPPSPPHSLHRSNAIRRARSHSSSSPHPLTPPNSQLRVRNTTSSPPRPSSIVPTPRPALLLNYTHGTGTPSTNQTSLSRSTALTSPSPTATINFTPYSPTSPLGMGRGRASPGLTSHPPGLIRPTAAIPMPCSPNGNHFGTRRCCVDPGSPCATRSFMQRDRERAYERERWRWESERERECREREEREEQQRRRRRGTVYVVDGEVVGGGGADGRNGTGVSGSDGVESPRLELRWIDALRAPGAGGYRTVVDVVEERRSGRLVVVNDLVGRDANGNGRTAGSRQDEVPTSPLGSGRGGLAGVAESAKDQNTNGVFIPSPSSCGVPTQRAQEESAREQRGQRQTRSQANQPDNFLTPIRRKPVPKTTPSSTGGVSTDTSTTPGDIDTPTPLFYQRRKAPMVRPPIPRFDIGAREEEVNGNGLSCTEKELLEEVADVRRIVEGRHKGGDGGGGGGGSNGVEDDDDMEKGVVGPEREKGTKEVDVRERERKENDMETEKVVVSEEGKVGKQDEGTEEMDWFWADEHGVLRYKRCGILGV